MEKFPYQHRRSLRLKDYDYSLAGAYFLTICTYDRQLLFGHILNGEMCLNDLGLIVEREWLKTPELRPKTELDAFVVMPNHFHAILLIDDSRRGVSHTPNDQSHTPKHQPNTPTQYGPTSAKQKFHSPSQTIGAIIRGFKSAVTAQINGHYSTSGIHVWQRNYYEHVIRNEKGLKTIREYIVANPLQW